MSEGDRAQLGDIAGTGSGVSPDSPALSKAESDYAAVIDCSDRQRVIDWLERPPFKERLWDWQYRPSTTDGRPSYVIVRGPSGELLGFNGLMPVRLRLAGRTEAAVWSCDFVVAPSARRQGVGGKLKELLRERSDFALALGISDSAASVHRRTGWHEPGTPVGDFIKGRGGAGWRGVVRRARQWLRKQWSAPRSLERSGSAGDTITLEPIQLDNVARLAGLWQRFEPDWPNAIVRDEEHLAWRYASCPLVRYDALVLRRDGVERAALVVRFHAWESAIVDYLGPCQALEEKRALVGEFARRAAYAVWQHCRSSDGEIAQALAERGFLARRGSRLRFHLTAPDERRADIRGDWRLYAGDSDGEFLNGARLFPQVTVREWSEEEYLGSEAAWSELQSGSDAHPLFMSWQWQSCWWQHIGRGAGLRLRVLAAYDRSNELVGAAAFVVGRVKSASGFRLRRQWSLGTIWGRGVGMRTEYQSIVAKRGAETGVVASMLAKLHEYSDWDDLVLGDVDQAARTTGTLLKFADGIGYVRRPQRAQDVTYRVDTRGSFEDYCAALSSSTRRRFFGLRGRLEREHGGVQLQYAGVDDVEAYFAELNRLHAIRWGRPAFEGPKLSFNIAFAKWLAAHGRLRLSRLVIAGRVRSVLFNARSGQEEINIQAGFDQTFTRLPLGSLHIGMAIEQCFSDSTVALDLLAGRGQNTDYKAAFCTERRALTTVQVVRHPVLALGYQVRDLLRLHAGPGAAPDRR